MNCNCVAEVNESMRDRNTRLSTCFLVRAGEMRLTLIIASEKIANVRGKKPLTVVPTYCPFCGVKCAPKDHADEPEPDA